MNCHSALTLLLVLLIGTVSLGSATSITLTAQTWTAETFQLNSPRLGACYAEGSGSGFQAISVSCESQVFYEPMGTTLHPHAAGLATASSGQITVVHQDVTPSYAIASLSLFGDYYFAGQGTQALNIGLGGLFYRGGGASLMAFSFTLDGVSYGYGPVTTNTWPPSGFFVDVALGQVHTASIDATIAVPQTGIFGYDFSKLGVTITPVPEPASLLLFSTGVAGLFARRKLSALTWRTRARP